MSWKSAEKLVTRRTFLPTTKDVKTLQRRVIRELKKLDEIELDNCLKIARDYDAVGKLPQKELRSLSLRTRNLAKALEIALTHEDLRYVMYEQAYRREERRTRPAARKKSLA